MGEVRNPRKLKRDSKSVMDFVFSDSNTAGDFNTQVKNHRIYRYVLGCSLVQNSKSRQVWDEKLTVKEENKSLVSEGR